MALAFKITEVLTSVDDGAGGTLNLTLQGRVQVNVQYYDTTAPGTILFPGSFTTGVGQSLAVMKQQAVNYGLQYQAAQALAAQLTGLINTQIIVA